MIYAVFQGRIYGVETDDGKIWTIALQEAVKRQLHVEKRSLEALIISNKTRHKCYAKQCKIHLLRN